MGISILPQNFVDIPHELKSIPRWVVWKLTPRESGKTTKPPYSVHTGKLCDHLAPEAWTTFDAAVAYRQQHDWVDGIGLVLTGDDDLSGADLDDCIDADGSLLPWAQDIVTELDSYTERSPSGMGVRIFTYGKLPEGRRRRGQVEMYDDARYLTVTGNHVPGTPHTIQQRAAQLAAVHGRVLGEQKLEASTGGRDAAPTQLSDDAMIERMFASRNGATIRALWDGNGGKDASANDLALCNHLAFWAGNDPAQIDRLFRQSKLFRPDKWDKKHHADGRTYGQGTIERAIKDQPNTYSGGQPDPLDILDFGPKVDEELKAYLLERGADDNGNAECVHYLHGNRYAYSPALGWLEYCGTHWEANGADYKVNRAVINTLIMRRTIAASLGEKGERIVKETKPTTPRKRNVVDGFKDLVAVNVGEFDADPDVLNTRSGVLGLRTGNLLSHGPSNRFTYCAPVEYNPAADATQWLYFLADVINHYAEIADWLQMSVGYSITGRTTEECLFYLFGPSRAGKGTFSDGLMNTLGRPLATGVSFSIFTKRRDGDSQNFDLAPLKPCRFIAASESGKYQALNEAAVKQITGGDMVYCSYKRKDMFSYKPQYKIWLSSNHPVKGDVDDDAFWGRLRVIEFPKSYLGMEDKTLKASMSNPEMLAGILAWAVQGAIRWYASTERGGLETPWAVQGATQGQRDQLDNVQQWLNECCNFAAENVVTNANLYKSYAEWCEDNGVTPKKAGGLGQALIAKGFERANKKIGGTSHRGYRGLILRGEPEIAVDG